jgi:ABC-type multidrug transport system permease subunit
MFNTENGTTVPDFSQVPSDHVMSGYSGQIEPGWRWLILGFVGLYLVFVMLIFSVHLLFYFRRGGPSNIIFYILREVLF